MKVVMIFFRNNNTHDNNCVYKNKERRFHLFSSHFPYNYKTKIKHLR